MKPELPLSQPEQVESYETRSSQSPSVESTPEVTIERGAERFEQRSEARAAVSDAAAVSLPPVVVDNTASNIPSQSPVQDGAHDDNPIIAADEDLIEKEWVDKAKKIISETKDDPYRREQEVSKLQADYIEKRYGRRIGQSGE